ncbi:hypothetical protein Kpol_1061p34 [Vanderwaltozyma polyspora DSM 70294]|uniref:GOLD domain-containing protein n=1 Tax=Vanderwaltozyma polyspora (strain ATCC 22028 / DSM 70294 / BCRC 21397 / CBS 2163 / NBRC 10782 / NRRL Y-8283 / UCD 57-17) TaxID=436907 RepID=A7TJF9_VANPO|nr:uncharacterized protein Kpol_1061p34 [Vanderwaltozyma polyspora DSM 70294]EDO17609.1 hypothetical protein Kpol_1061p34 [Vanderwaltozyma polyspora DSM 70294]
MLFDTVLKVVLLLFLFPVETFGFYYYSSTGEKKCFNKELSKGTLLKGKYNVQIYQDDLKSYMDASADKLEVVIDVEEVFDDNHRVVHQKGSPLGDFTFIALDSGEHRVCLEPNNKSWMGNSKAKISIEFEVGSEAQLDSKKKRTVESLHEKVNMLNAKISEIKREQALVREREANFRDISESANSKAMWWTIFQVVALGGICVWQMKHLRSFFVKQKVL